MRLIAPHCVGKKRRAPAWGSDGSWPRVPGLRVEHGGVANAAGAANADMVTAMPAERRTTGALALFEYGYRPFFLLAALHGAVLVPVWVAAVFGWVVLPVEMEVSTPVES